MKKYLIIALLLCLQIKTFASQQSAAKQPEQPQGPDTSGFQTGDSFIDTNEAVRSKQYVRRAVLSSVVKGSSKFALGRPYVNHLMGFSAVMHRGRQTFAKYVSGAQGLSVGYAFNGGFTLEAGAEFSALSNAFAGLRYIHRPEKFSLWPFIGIGGGTEIGMKFSDAPPEAATYSETKQMGLFTLGFLVPVVDVGIKAEARGVFYGTSRWALTTGIGVIVFL